MKLINTYLFILPFLLLSYLVDGQSSRMVHDTIITQLVKMTANGNKRGLRDLGTFLNHPKLKNRVQAILQRLTFFEDKQIYNSKEKFLNYFYKNENNIRFNGLISAFDNPSEKKNKLRFKFKKIEFDSFSEKNMSEMDMDQLINYIKSITSSKNNYPIQKMLEIYINHLSSDFPREVMDELIDKIASQPSLNSLNTLLELGQQTQNLGSIPKLVENITLYKKPDNQSGLAYLDDVKVMIDSVGKIDDIRLEFYKNKSKTQPNFYFDKVDYLGHLLIFSKSNSLVNQLMIDLSMTHNSRALFYLASYIFLQKDHPKLYHTALHTMEEMIQKKLGVENEQGVIVYDDFDIIAFKNMVRYWSKYVEDYLWDAEINHFIHKDEFNHKVRNYDSYIKLLYNKSDSIAKFAYLKLANGEPEKISELINKIRPKQKLLNPVIPTLKYKYLEQLTILNQYCKKNGVVPSLKFKNKLLLHSLTDEISLQEQYNIEKQIIEYFGFLEITQLEQTAILFANNKKVNLSISRILDAIYSKYWDAILKETSKLSFYLKKAAILSEIGVSGTSQNYLNKFSKQQVQSKVLQRLFKVTQDQDIKNQILKLYKKFKILVEVNAQNSNELLENINKLSSNKSSKYTLSNKQMKFIYSTIEKNQYNLETVDFLFSKLENYHNIKLVPKSIKLATKNGTTQYVKSKISKLLGLIYDENQAIDFWIQLWKKDKKSYKQWGENILSAKIKYIQNSQKLKSKQINNILQSRYFSKSYKTICLENISKVNPRKIKYLKFHALNPKTDLAYFESILIPVKDLDNIVLFFDSNNSKKQGLLIDFLVNKTRDSPLDKKAKLVNSLFRQPFFITALENGILPKKQVNVLKSILIQNLEDADYISEYEEELSITNIAKINLIDQNIIEQIKQSIQLDVPENVKAKLQYEIISQIDLNDVVYMLPYFHLLSISENYNPKEFLYKDFGIPIFEPYPAQQLDDLANLLESGNRFELYKYFLSLNKIDFTERRGNLDFDKIYKLLKFGTSTTFCSSSGGVDDYFTYVVIKLLEFHFRTRLGFHKKLNENQTFFTYTAFSRAEKWMQFLIDQQLVKKDYSNSFNHLIK